MNGNNVVIALGVLYGFAFPLGMIFWWKKKTGIKSWPFIAGAIGYIAGIIGALLVVIALRIILLIVGSSLIATNGNSILYGLLVACITGAVEVLVLLFGFKVLIQENNDKESAVAFGIGFGGMGVIISPGMTYIIALLAKYLSPFGVVAAMQLEEASKELQPGIFYLTMLGGIAGMLFFISLSMIVLVAVKEREKKWLYPVAIFMTTFASVPSVLQKEGVDIPQWAIVVDSWVISILAFFMAKKLMDKNREQYDFPGDGVSGSKSAL